ncbi:MAG: oligosaccharide flippase family protein [Gammaproteobacteria bacterium]|nr:oligosaccharide flippase family protein [Gammaproteobacteria bacterium]MCY4339191.1 oligosaccharide flippase family protein [Gammaproteobacteria bacterium]
MLWMAAILVIQFLGSIVQLLLVTRILGLEGFGILALFIAVTSLSYGLMSMPGHEAITTYVTRSMVNEEWEEAARILRFIFMACFILALLTYSLLTVFSHPVSRVLGIDNSHVNTMLIYGLSGICMAVHRESMAVLRLAGRLSWGFVVICTAILIQFAGLLITLALDGSLGMVVLALVAGACINGFGMLLVAIIATRTLGIDKLFTSWSVKIPKDTMRYQAISFCQAKIGTLGGNVDMLLLGALTNPSQVGLYRAASRILAITRMPFQPIAPVLQAEYSRRWYAHEGAALRTTARRFTLLALGLAVSGYLLLLLFHRPIISVMLGEEFVDTGRLLIIMIPGALVFTSITALYILPAATGHAVPSLIWHLAALVTQVSVLLFLLPEYGAVGAAWANMSYFLVWGLVAIPFSVLILRRSYRLS